MEMYGWTDQNAAFLNDILNPKPKVPAVKYPTGSLGMTIVLRKMVSRRTKRPTMLLPVLWTGAR